MALSPYDDVEERTKLLQVRGQIEQLLRANDLCGDVVLAGRGRCEVFMVLDASWSRCWTEPVDGGEVLRVRSKVADYGGDREAQRVDLEYTTGMVSTFAEVKMRSAMAWLSATKLIDSVTGAEHTPLRHEPKQ